MSHCIACDALLTATEASRKHKVTKDEIGLCNKCLGYVEEIVHIPTTEPYDDYLTELEEDLFGGFPTQSSLGGLDEGDDG